MILYEQALQDVINRDPRVMVMTAENRAPLRTLATTLGDRFIDVGICEQTMVGMAAGLALRGRRPVIHALATFLTMRAFEFIRTDIGIGHLPVTLVGFVPGFLSEANGPTHQAVEDIAIMRGIPGMNVFCPANEEEMAGALPLIISSGDPWYIRYTSNARRPGRDAAPIAVGKAEIIRGGTDISILTYGPLLDNVLDAAVVLEDDGFSVRIINMRFLKPFDEETIIAALMETSLVVTVEDHFRIGGLASIVAESLAESIHRISAAGSLPRLSSISLGERWFTPALLPDILKTEGFTPDAIAGRIRTSYHAEVRHAE